MCGKAAIPPLVARSAGANLLIPSRSQGAWECLGASHCVLRHTFETVVVGLSNAGLEYEFWLGIACTHQLSATICTNSHGLQTLLHSEKLHLDCDLPLIGSLFVRDHLPCRKDHGWSVVSNSRSTCNPLSTMTSCKQLVGHWSLVLHRMNQRRRQQNRTGMDRSKFAKYSFLVLFYGTHVLESK